MYNFITTKKPARQPLTYKL